MPDIKINKQLNRPDGGKITSGSLATSNPSFDEDNLRVIFPLFLFVSETTKDDGKNCIPSCVEFSNKVSFKMIPMVKLIKQCTVEEWEDVNIDSGAGALTKQWMQDCIDEIIGEGFTEQV